MNHERHREVTEIAFGYKYVLVHKWLDGTYGKWVNTKHSQFNHWLARHHVEAIDKQYSDDTKRGVAYLHVVSDIADRWRDWFLPKNETELRTYLAKQGIKLKTKTKL